jgi:type I restriction enzyme, S subunit
VRLCNYKDVYYREAISADQEFMAATATPEQIAAFGLRNGDVIITKDSETADDIGVPVFVREAAPDLVCGYHLALIRPRTDRVDPRFLYWVMCSRPVRSQLTVAATGVTRFGLRSGAIKGARVELPALEDQRRVADFLDTEAGAHDSSVLRLRRLSGLVQERLIAYRSFRLGCDHPLRSESHLQAGWSLTRLKFLARLQTGVTLGQAYGDLELVERPYLRVANVQDGRLDLDDVRTMRVPADRAARYQLQSGDVLMTEGGDNDKLGRGTVWGDEIPGCLHQNHVFAVRVDETRLRPEFLAAVMASIHGKTYFQSTAHQTTNLASTNSTKLMNLPVPLPGLAAQDELVRVFQMKEQQAERLDRAFGRLRSCVMERMDALTAAYVTGQLDPPSDRVPVLSA